MNTKMKRARNADATREAILDAARTAFSRRGYDAAGLREIAVLADCNVALISRYFGSKEDLFRQVMKNCIDLDALFQPTQDGFVNAVVDTILSKGLDHQTFDPLAAALRSSSSDTARKITKEEMGDPMVNSLANHLGGDDALMKAALVLSVIAGFDVARNFIEPTALSRENDLLLRPKLEAVIRVILE